MKVLSWNVKGASRKIMLHHLRTMIESHKPNFLVIIETMMKEENALRVVAKLSRKYPAHAIEHTPPHIARKGNVFGVI